ncbi:MAG: DEAD/DEAH box helicase [SAR324 cluster bacterium]|nr:DEAD/DEAH box helicase [SAR324 cluster bacterium]
MTFQEMGLSDAVLRALEEAGFSEPTPIQEQVIPLQIGHNDVIGQAQTGTGKTAAFGIPLIERLSPRQRDDGKHTTDALILTPTRELASQVSEELRKIGLYKSLSVVTIYGGVSIEQQVRTLRRRTNIIVGTPGRVLDHLSRGTINLSGVRHFVLDEADEMLDMGFIEDIQTIMQSLPEKRQILLFSATMSPEIDRIAAKYMNQPSTVSVSNSNILVPRISQWLYKVKSWERFEGLCRILSFHRPELALIFCQTKRDVDELYRQLHERGYKAEALHGDYSQHQRDQVMQKFRNHELDLLIATDLAARGIDSKLDMVVNYNVPENPETYVHRIGRTGRAGREGLAITFVSQEDYRQLYAIEKLIKIRLQYRDLPTREELKSHRLDFLQMRIEEGIQDAESADYVELAAKLLENGSPIEMLATTLRVAGDSLSPQISVDRQHELNSENTGAEYGMVRFFLSGGRTIGLMAGDVVRTVTQHTKIPGAEVGKIMLQNDFSFVEVPETWARHLLESLPSFSFRGNEISVKPARAREKVARFRDFRNNNNQRSRRPQRRYSNG